MLAEALPDNVIRADFAAKTWAHRAVPTCPECGHFESAHTEARGCCVTKLTGAADGKCVRLKCDCKLGFPERAGRAGFGPYRSGPLWCLDCGHAKAIHEGRVGGCGIFDCACRLDGRGARSTKPKRMAS